MRFRPNPDRGDQLSKRLIAMLAGVVAIAVIAAGCGSSSSSDSTGGGEESSSSSLTKAEFIKAGDAICLESNEALEGEANEFAEENGIDIGKPTTEQQEEVVSEVVAPAIREQAEGISELGAPSGEEEEVEAIVDAVENGAEEAEEEPSSLVEAEGGGPFAEANELANAYGFKVCGE
ncbi:MAG: hypothetical protein H0X42_01105 [Solirubrobacterales bacterium]|nr:hypothetical protein [Solirubrobacterales bacterium]